MYESVKTFLLGTLPVLLNGSADALKASAPPLARAIAPPPACDRSMRAALAC